VPLSAALRQLYAHSQSGAWGDVRKGGGLFNPGHMVVADAGVRIFKGFIEIRFEFTRHIENPTENPPPSPDLRAVVVAFRGTLNGRDALTDLHCTYQDVELGGSLRGQVLSPPIPQVRASLMSHERVDQVDSHGRWKGPCLQTNPQCDPVSQHHLHHVDESTPTAPHCL
jgi:hypothetical protein